MGATSIEWCHFTMNPWVGCTKVSAECKHCYAEVGTTARISKAKGLPLWGPNSHRHVTKSTWRDPIKWNRDAELAGERRRVFCASMADVFEDVTGPSVAAVAEARARLWELIGLTPWLDWLLLTKRPENVLRMVPSHFLGMGFPPNVWIGTTAGTQASADERIPVLLNIPARVRFVSVEPLLERVVFREHWLAGRLGTRGLQWVIVGGESGPHARECWVDDVEGIVDQCVAHQVPVLVKQLGAVSMESDDHHSGGSIRLSFKHPKGGDWDEWPEHLAHLKRREYPVST